MNNRIIEEVRSRALAFVNDNVLPDKQLILIETAMLVGASIALAEETRLRELTA
jgi:hypothetical protein